MYYSDHSWFISLVPVLIVVVFSGILLIYAYLKVRPKFPIKVNCWFCQKTTDVPYANRNCWDCPHCEQYNGFSPDGSYNKVIPAQHDELLNHSVTAKSSFTKKSSPTSSKSPLCRKCTINQDLKIKQLASFTPRNPLCFDEEVEEYRQHLERAYQLCESCKLVVNHTLNQQQGWLLDQYRKHLLSLRSQPTQRVIAWWQRGLPVIWLQWTQMASAVTVLVILMSQCHGLIVKKYSEYISPDVAYILEIAPSYDHIVASVMTCTVIVITGCSAYKRKVDIITAVLWFVMLIHKWLLLWPYITSQISEEDLKTGHIVVISLTCIVNMAAAFTTWQVCPPKNLVVKRLNQNDVYRGRNIAERFSSPSSAYSGQSKQKSCDQSSSQCSSETSQSCALPQSSTIGLLESNKYSPVQPPVSGRTTPIHTSFSASYGELEWGLGKLSLGPSEVRNRNCSIFKTKSYGKDSGENVFQASPYKTSDSEQVNNGYSHLLRPAKLNIRRNVTQTSWVAGGYWRELGGTLSKAVQSGCNIFETSLQSPSFSPASRTSSQSSGFHSHSSNSPRSSPNSCNDSTCDVDRFSVLSEPVTSHVTCPYSYNEHTRATVSKVPLMGMSYYGTLPMCIPHIYQSSMTAPASVFSGRNVPWMVNPHYFGATKPFPSSYYFSPYPHSIKQFPHASVIPANSLSRTRSSVQSKEKLVVCEQMKNNNMNNMWQIMKHNPFLSFLCVGNVICNVVGLAVLIYSYKYIF